MIPVVDGARWPWIWSPARVLPRWFESERLIALYLAGTNPYLGYIPDDLSAADEAFVAAAQM